jgi:hypothetical protein
MRLKKRLTIRRLAALVALFALCFCIVREHPSLKRQRLRERNARMVRRVNEGKSVIDTFRALHPPDIATSAWHQRLISVDDAWANFGFSDPAVPETEIENALNEMRAVAAGATSGTAEGDLYAILDVIAHAQINGASQKRGLHRHVAVAFESDQRDSFLGFERGTGANGQLVDYALKLAGMRSVAPLAGLRGALRAPDWRVRAMACRGLREIGANGGMTESVTALAGALKDRDGLVRMIAMESLRAMALKFPGPTRKPRAQDQIIAATRAAFEGFIGLFGDAMRDPESAVRVAAIDVLGTLDSIGSNVRSTSPLLIEVVRGDPDPDARWHGALVLGRVGEPVRAVPVLIEALVDPDTTVQRAAAEGLARLGPRGREAVPELTAALDTDNFRVRQAVKAALQNIRGE